MDESKNRRKEIKIFVIIIIISLSIIAGISIYQSLDEESYDIRIGWQIPWATQGQLVQIMKNNEYLQEYEINPEFIGFSYGGPLNEAALANRVDVVLTADQPAATLVSRSDEWLIIGRLMYNRVCLYVPPKSSIENVSELKGKTVAMPFGAAAQRMVLKEEIDAGLDPETDVNNIHLGIYEQSDLIKDPEVSKWGDIDAIAGFDPTPAIFEEKGLIKLLAVGKIVSVIMMSRDIIDKHPEYPIFFLEAFIKCYDFYRNNINISNQWFIEESGLEITSDALAISASIEPNLEANTIHEIRINFTENDYTILQEAADFLYQQDMIEKKIIMKDYIDISFQKKIDRGYI